MRYLSFMQMFKGNVDGDTIRHNKFEVPIIAQWVKINPTRWRDRISLRVELYGCEYGEYKIEIYQIYINMIEQKNRK